MATTGTSRFRDALAHRDFRRLLTSFSIDQLGTWASSVVLLVYVFDRTGSPTYLAVTTAARWVPGLLLGSYGGALADRYDRARLMRASASASCLLAAVMAGVAAVDGPIPLLLLLSGLLGMSASPYGPAAGALTADVVPETDLAAANGLYGLVDSLTVVLGPLLGAVLLAAGSPFWGFAVNALSFLAAAVLVGGVSTRSRGDAGARGEGVGTQIADGVRALAADSVARTLVLFMLLDTAVYGATSVLYIPLSESLGTGSSGYGYLLAGQALGSVLAAGVAKRMSARRRLAPVIIGGMLLLSLPFAAVSLVGSPAAAFLLQVAAGTGMIVIDLVALTALQRDLPREKLSRVLGFVDALVLAACLVGSIASAALLRAFGLETTLLAVGLGFSAVAVLCSRPLLTADGRSAALHHQLTQRVARLEQLDLLAAAARPSLERMALGLQEVAFTPGAVVLLQGEPADALWVVQSGRLVVTVDGDVVNEVAAGEYVGEIGLLHRRPRTATVTAGTEAALWRIDGVDFQAALDPVGASASMRNLAVTRLARRRAGPARNEELEPR